MSAIEETTTEAQGVSYILRDGLAALAVLVTAFVVEAGARWLFPNGMPLTTRIILLIGDITMIIAFLIPAIRLIKVALSLLFGGRTDSDARAGAALAALPRAVLGVYRTSLGAGAITGAIVSTIFLLLVLLAWAPWWVRFTLFAVGLGAVIFGIVAALWDAQASRRALNESFRASVLVMFIMLPIGFLFMIFAFGAQAENWTGVLQHASQILLRVRPA